MRRGMLHSIPIQPAHVLLSEDFYDMVQYAVNPKICECICDGKLWRIVGLY